MNLVSNLDFSGFVFLLPNANQAHWGQIGTKTAVLQRKKKSSASFFATSEILVPKISFCDCFTKLGKPLFYFGPAFFLLVSSGMLWLIPGKKEPFGPKPFHIRSFASKMQMLPLTYPIYAMGSKKFWIRILILIHQRFDVEPADFYTIIDMRMQRHFDPMMLHIGSKIRKMQR